MAKYRKFLGYHLSKSLGKTFDTMSDSTDDKS